MPGHWTLKGCILPLARPECTIDKCFLASSSSKKCRLLVWLIMSLFFNKDFCTGEFRVLHVSREFWKIFKSIFFYRTRLNDCFCQKMWGFIVLSPSCLDLHNFDFSIKTLSRSFTRRQFINGSFIVRPQNFLKN